MMKPDMAAWVLEKPGVLTCKNVARPEPQAGELLVKIAAVSLCNGSDPEIFHGHEAYPPPLIFGHEAAGTVVACGEAVTDFQIGDRIFWWCTMGLFAEYAVVNPAHAAVFRIPENIPWHEAAILELVIAASRALMPFSAQASGKRLAILGLGPSGLVAVQYAKALGFARVYGWELDDMRRLRALELGADQVLNPAAATFADDAKLLEPVDIALDMMGDDLWNGDTFTAFLRQVKNGGTVISYGHPEHGRRFSPYIFQCGKLLLRGPENDLAEIRVKGREVMQLVAAGRIQLRPLITFVGAFEELGERFAQWLARPDDPIKMVFELPQGGAQ